MGMFIVLLGASGCATVPFEGHVGSQSSERLASQRRLAESNAVRFALLAADTYPDDLRAQRKAAELLAAYLSTARNDARNKTYLRSAATLARLENHEEACTTRLDAGRVRLAAGDDAGAARTFANAARDCRSVTALRAAGWPLKKLERCSEVVELAAQVWPGASREEWVTVMDTVAMCSDDVSLQQNLAFAPSEVVSDYLALLQRRDRQRAAEEARLSE
jgi:hypothetical protein